LSVLTKHAHSMFSKFGSSRTTASQIRNFWRGETEPEPNFKSITVRTGTVDVELGDRPADSGRRMVEISQVSAGKVTVCKRSGGRWKLLFLNGCENSLNSWGAHLRPQILSRSSYGGRKRAGAEFFKVYPTSPKKSDLFFFHSRCTTCTTYWIRMSVHWHPQAQLSPAQKCKYIRAEEGRTKPTPVSSPMRKNGNKSEKEKKWGTDAREKP
jgi:hypothetical protein